MKQSKISSILSILSAAILLLVGNAKGDETSLNSNFFFDLGIGFNEKDRQSIYLDEYSVLIGYSKEESIRFASDAIRKAYRFFSVFGYSEQYPLKIIFQKEVAIETQNGDLVYVYGKLGKGGIIYLTEWNEPLLFKHNTYDFEMCEDLYESIIIHEIAHFIVENICRDKIDLVLTEYVAYAAQFSQMKPSLRNGILDRQLINAFNTDEIYIEIMFMNPLAFAVKSYLHFRNTHGRFLRKILDGTHLNHGKLEDLR